MRRGPAIFAGKVLIAAALLALVYRHVSLDDVALDVRRLDVAPLVGFFAILFVNTFVSALKWKWILEADGIRLSLAHLFGSYLIGAFLNLFLPSTVGGDAYRVASVGRGRVAKSAASVIADRLSGLIALAVICALFSVVTHGSIGHHNYIIFAVLLLCALLGLASALLWPAYSRRLLTALGLRRIPRLDRFVERLFVSFRSYREHPTLIGRIIGISFLFQFLVSVAVFLLARSLALRVSLVDFLVFVPIITIVESIPISIYGLGLRDAGYVFFFKEIDLPGAETHALSMSVLYVGLTAVYAALGGLLLAFRLLRRGSSPVSGDPGAPSGMGPEDRAHRVPGSDLDPARRL